MTTDERRGGTAGSPAVRHGPCAFAKAGLAISLLAVVLLAVAFLALPASANGDLEFLHPFEGSHVSGKVEVVVHLDVTADNVTFHYRSSGDWVLIGTDTVPDNGDFNMTWDTQEVPDGSYELSANASLGGGLYDECLLANLTVDNTVPTASFVTPEKDSRLNGLVEVVVRADDDAVSVVIWLDRGARLEMLGEAQRIQGSDNWTFTWNTTGETELADVQLLAAVTDAAGNEGKTQQTRLEVDNVPPVVVLEAPQDGEVVDGDYLLVANCTDPNLATLEFEWRPSGSDWQRLGGGTWNGSMASWVYLWDSYAVGERPNASVRAVATDDLGQRSTSASTGLNVTDVPPTVTFLAPLEGAHLTGRVNITIAADNDTVSVSVDYLVKNGWVHLGNATRGEDGLWRMEWSTGGRSHSSTRLRANATDNRSTSTGMVLSLEVDNTAPIPNIIRPSAGDYHLFGDYELVASSDRDTVYLSFHYKWAGEWVKCGDATYDPDTDRWYLLWDVKIRVIDSAICATAVDEVGLTGHDLRVNIELGLEPGDRAPAFTPDMPRVLTFLEDTELILNLSGYIDDNDLTTIRVYVTGEDPALLKVDGENRTGVLFLRFIPEPNSFGVSQMTVHAIDPSGQEARSNLTVEVRSDPDPPFFHALLPNLYVHPDVPYEFNYTPYITDLDNDISELEILPPASDYVTRNETDRLKLIFEFPESMLGTTSFITLTVMDPDGMQANQSIVVNVTNDWVPELRRPLNDIHLLEDAPVGMLTGIFNLDDYFYDKDHDTLYYSYGNTNVTVEIGLEYPHPVSLRTPRDWHGVDRVTFRANDPTGALVEDTITIYVDSVNDPPMFVKDPTIPLIIIRANESFDFDLSPYVVDVDDELTDLEIVTDDPFAVKSPLFPLGLRLTYPYRHDSFLVNLRICDVCNDSVEQIIRVRVLSDNYPPELRTSPPDIVMEEGAVREHAFDVTSAWDHDWITNGGNWADLTYQFVCDVAIFIVNYETGWVDIHLADPDWNTYNGSKDRPVRVLLRVIDDHQAFREYTFRLSVLPQNDAPVVGSIPPVIIDRGTRIIDLSKYIMDVDTPMSMMSFEFRNKDDPGQVVNYASVNGGYLFLNYQDAKPHTETLVMTVVDGDHRIETEIYVDVQAPTVESEDGQLWYLLLAVLATAGVAVYASKMLWGRFEPPSVMDVFLVYGDGVIIRHMSKRGTISMDEDLAIAMLTAIQEFVQQSMRSAQLKSMQAGDNNILIERDPDRLFYIAVIHTGTVSEELRRAVNSATRSIKENFGPTLRKWDGNIAKFKGVEKYLQEILVITHAHIPEGVHFEMEGISSIEPGKSFLFQGKDVTRTHNIFRGLVGEHGSGLLISRVHPQRLHPSVATVADCVWLSKTPTKRGVSPSNTTMILHEIATHVRDNVDTVVCLDGLEYLMVHNSSDEVAKFLSELTDMVQVDNFIMMVHVDPSALDEATLAKLSRDMVPVSDRK